MAKTKRIMMDENRGFGVYVHIPYCVHKCSYCDFYSFTDYASRDFESFLKALKCEISSARDWMLSKDKVPPYVDSIFFGGGTPSLLPARHIRQIISWISESFALKPVIEITLEANPETVTKEYCSELHLTKVNRVSLGAQSFKASNLEALERLGKRESIHEATRLLWEAGFRNLSLDLIFGIPGQSVEHFKEDLHEACGLPISHLSAYQLTLKPAHKLYHELPSDDVALEFYEILNGEISKFGMEQYEISNYSKPSKICNHNLLYWNGGDYLGVGPSASSRFFFNGVFHHRKQLSDVKKYLHAPAFLDSQIEETTFSQTVLEATFLELRKNRGVSLDAFNARYSYDLRKGKDFDRFKREGLVYEKEGDLLFTERGRLLADTVTARLADC